MADPTALSLSELARAYRAGALSPVEATEAYLAKLAPGDIYRIITAERARKQARAAEQALARGIDSGPLQGVPIALKDLIDTEGDVTAAGSKVKLSDPPAASDAPVAARLDAAGAVFLGKTTMTELAYSGLGLNPHFGTPPNIFEPERIPGGSSSGSAAAVAHRLACAAIGSDTGGSVRIPAAFNGLVGLKTTNGALPTAGVTPLSITLDTIGPIARTVEDAYHLWRALAAKPARPFKPHLPERLRLLVPTTVVLEQLEPEVAHAFEATCQALAKLGHVLCYQPLPSLSEILALYRRYGSFAGHEALALYEALLDAHGDAVDPRVASRILEQRGRLATDYLRLVLAQRAMVSEFWERYRDYQALLLPTVAILPPLRESLASDAAYFAANALCLRNTMLFNFLAGPALSLPAPSDRRVGVMVATAPHTEGLALAIGQLIAQLA